MGNSLANIIRYMEDGHDHWKPIAIVDIVHTGEKMPGYGDNLTCRIKDDKKSNLYLKTNAEISDGTSPIKYYYVVQWSQYEDSYYGFLLIPYGKRFLQVEYSC